MLMLTPGPTPVPDRVLRAIARPPIPHRSAEFESILASCHEPLQKLFDTRGVVLTLAGSGTTAMEAAIWSLAAARGPGGTIVVAHSGKFGERWAESAKRAGAAIGMIVRECSASWGEPISSDALAETLRAVPDARLVVFTHCETSTATVSDARALARAAREHASDALIIADGITSVGAIPCAMDEWGIDAVACASQKALGLPPGLGFVALGERATAALNGHNISAAPGWHGSPSRDVERDSHTAPLVPLPVPLPEGEGVRNSGVGANSGTGVSPVRTTPGGTGVSPVRDSNERDKTGGTPVPPIQQVSSASPVPMSLDLGRALAAHRSGRTPFTPAINLIYGLRESLGMIEEEGLNARLRRAASFAAAARAATIAMGLSLPSSSPSDSVTAIALPDSLADPVRAWCRAERGVALAGGQDAWAGAVVRFSHMGFLTSDDTLTGLTALADALDALDALAPGRFSTRAGVAAARDALAAGVAK